MSEKTNSLEATYGFKPTFLISFKASLLIRIYYSGIAIIVYFCKIHAHIRGKIGL